MSRGVAMVLFIVLIGIWDATLVQSATSSGPEAVQNDLVLLALPGLVISFVSMFGRDGSAPARSWFNELIGAAVVAASVALVLYA